LANKYINCHFNLGILLFEFIAIFYGFGFNVVFCLIKFTFIFFIYFLQQINYSFLFSYLIFRLIYLYYSYFFLGKYAAKQTFFLSFADEDIPPGIDIYEIVKKSNAKIYSKETKQFKQDGPL
jgi:hypothetical protein